MLARRQILRQAICARAGRERGTVILFVLGLILLTSLLLTQFIARAHTELLADARRSQLEPLRDEAYSALEVTFAVLADIEAADQGLHAPAQGWGEPLDYAEYDPPSGFAAEVQVGDESGKLSLANAGNDTVALVNLLTNLGCLSSDAERIVDAILAWTRPEYPARYADYRTITAADGAPELVPPQSPLRSFDELRLIPIVRELLCDENGDWNEIGANFRASTTLFPSGQVNLNTASPEVLDALGLDADRIASAREQAGAESPQVFYSLGDVGASLGQAADTSAVGVDATQLRVHIITRQGGRKFELTAIIQRGDSPVAPPPPTTEEEPTSESRPWTRNSIDSAFRILEIQENNGF